VRLLVFTRMLREIAGQPQPILKNVTIQDLAGKIEETLKLIHSTKTNTEEKYSISPEELASFGGSEVGVQEITGAVPSVN
jgi:hypothetical protein